MINLTKTTRRMFTKMFASSVMAMTVTSMIGVAHAETKPAPFDKTGQVKIAAIPYLSTGDFFQAYLTGIREQSRALGIDLRIFDSRQDAALQANMVDQAIAMQLDGIIVNHGLSENMTPAVKRAIDAGLKVIAFDVNVNHPDVPQIQQSDYDLARLALEQAVRDNGTSWTAGYVYVPGILPLDRRNKAWVELKQKHSGIKEVAQFGTLDNPIANSVANQARAVLSANPDINVVFAPYDEFAKGVKIAVDEAGMTKQVKIYSADISTADISAMREKDSAWVATVATNPKVVGHVTVRAMAMLLTGEKLDNNIVVPPTLVTKKMLHDKDIKNMEDLEAKLPIFAHANVLTPSWIPLPK